MINHPNRKSKVKAKAKARTRPKKVATVRVAAKAAPPVSINIEPAPKHYDHDRDYESLRRSIEQTFRGATSGTEKIAIFTTEASPDVLYETYLNSMVYDRQIHECNACRQFIQRYGGLVTISADGSTTPVMWSPNDVPLFYRASVRGMHDYVKHSDVTGVFLSPVKTWGQPVTGKWEHLAVAAGDVAYHDNRAHAVTAEQAMAAHLQNYKTVRTALVVYAPADLDQALRLLENDRLTRSERFIGPVKWLRQLHSDLRITHTVNTIWRAIASAPEGYCHPRASVVGSLLDDIASGVPFDDIQVSVRRQGAADRLPAPPGGTECGHLARG